MLQNINDFVELFNSHNISVSIPKGDDMGSLLFSFDGNETEFKNTLNYLMQTSELQIQGPEVFPLVVHEEVTYFIEHVPSEYQFGFDFTNKILYYS